MSEKRLLDELVRLRGIDPVAETAQRIITVMMARGALTSQASIVADGLGVDAITRRRVSVWLFETADALPEAEPRAALPPPPCSALDLVSSAWTKKQACPKRQPLPLEFACIIHGDDADVIAEQLEYIAFRMREAKWSSGSGGGRGLSAVWEMFQHSPNPSHAADD